MIKKDSYWHGIVVGILHGISIVLAIAAISQGYLLDTSPGDGGRYMLSALLVQGLANVVNYAINRRGQAAQPR
jgi:hypothetical protein